MVLPEEFERFTKVAKMVRTSDALHKHVVGVYLHDFSDQIFEHSINHPLVGGFDVF